MDFLLDPPVASVLCSPSVSNIVTVVDPNMPGVIGRPIGVSVIEKEWGPSKSLSSTTLMSWLKELFPPTVNDITDSVEKSDKSACDSKNIMHVVI